MWWTGKRALFLAVSTAGGFVLPSSFRLPARDRDLCVVSNIFSRHDFVDLSSHDRRASASGPDEESALDQRSTAARPTTRRSWMQTCSTVLATSLPLISAIPSRAEVVATGDLPALAMESTPASAPISIEMKDFVDPKGLFSIRIPKSFFAIRRSAKGDLPDSQGEGRRGSTLFTAGDMAKAEVIAVERFPTRALLEENGIEATGDLTTFPALGEAAAVANLLNMRRERDKPGMSSTQIIPNSLTVTADGKELQFQLKTEIQVQKPELLLEQYGVAELFRITTAKASLRANDGNMMAVFASALETDFNGPDGQALQEAVNSFRVSDQAPASSTLA